MSTPAMSAQVQEALNQIEAVLDEGSAAVVSTDLLRKLRELGYVRATASAAIAFGVQQGELELDDDFGVSRAAPQYA